MGHCSVDEYIEDNDMVAFVTGPCPFCRQAMRALEDAGYRPTRVECPKGSKIRKELEKNTGSSSVPKVYVKGNFIGGCNDGGMGGVMANLSNGKIAELMGSWVDPAHHCSSCCCRCCRCCSCKHRE